jgi:hypothetical protein
MTPERELAVKCKELSNLCSHKSAQTNDQQCFCVQQIESLLSEAMEKAFKEDRRLHNNRVEEVVKEIRLDERERAAKIAENWRCNDKGNKCYPCDCGNEVPQDAIAAQIRKAP